MRNDIYDLAAISLCFIDASASEVRTRCEELHLSDRDRAGLLKAVDTLHHEYSEQLGQLGRDELGRPLDASGFDALFFKVNCLASAKDALAAGQ